MSDEPDGGTISKVRSRSNRYGIIGIAMAFLGLALGVVSPWIVNLVEPQPQQPAAENIADFTARIVKAVKEKMKRQPPANAPAPQQISWTNVMAVAGAGLGLLGVLLGSVSWIRREDHRISGVAALFGAAAIAWQYLLLAIAIVIFLVIFAIVLHAIDF
ncbi:MAG: hypothetical protein WD648_00455 [Planctomycetaceae bacterium]